MSQDPNRREPDSRRPFAPSGGLPALLSAGALLIAAAALSPAQGQGRPIPNTIPDPNVTGSGRVAVSPESGPLVAPGPVPDLILLYTGRAVGYVEPCG